MYAIPSRSSRASASCRTSSSALMERNHGHASSPRGIQRSPDLRAVLGLAPHRIALLDAEGVVERLEVHQRPDGTEDPGRVGIDRELLAKRVLADVGAPHLREREEEALLGREPVDELALLAGERALERFVGDAGAAEVGD